MSKPKKHSQDQVAAFVAELNSQTDRGAAIIAAAVLDDLLKIVLTERFIELGSERHDGLFKTTGAPLSSFSAKIEMAFAVGIASNSLRLMLHLIRDVRNAFAHRMEQITFDHPDVAGQIQSRVFDNFKKPDSTNRSLFLDCFSAVALLMYSTLSSPNSIRIKALEETHKDYFQRVLRSYAEVVKQANAAKEAEGEGRA